MGFVCVGMVRASGREKLAGNVVLGCRPREGYGRTGCIELKDDGWRLGVL